MDTTIVIMIVVGLIFLGGAWLMLSRSWGGGMAAPGMPPVPPADLTRLVGPEIADLLARGNKIEAIKRVRELTGLGLKEAKEYVEALLDGDRRPGSLPPAAGTAEMGSPELEAQVRALLQQGNTIQAIKLVREITGLGLKEAKEYVESL